MSLSTDEAREMRRSITAAGLDFRTVYQQLGIVREVDATPEQVRHVESVIAEQTGSRPQRLDGRGVESLDVRYDADPEFARHVDSYVAGAPREGDTVRVGSGDYHGHIGIYEGRGELGGHRVALADDPTDAPAIECDRVYAQPPAAERTFDIRRIGPLIDQMQSAQMKLVYALGQANMGNRAQLETVGDAMRDITHTLAHIETEIIGG